MLRVALKCPSSKNLILFTGKYKTHSFLNLTFQNQINRVSVVQLNCSQKRFNSSKVSEGSLHKVFFVNAESPPDLKEETVTSDSIEYIPPPPVPPSYELAEEAGNVLNSLGEPTFQSLGLGGWSPVGLALKALEFLHVSTGLPWWGTIAIATVVIRTSVFPLFIKVQRNNAVMQNFMPMIKGFQEKISEARASGNNLEAARVGYEMQSFMKEKGLTPIKNAMLPLIQAPVFISMFMALRRCSNLPLESFSNGGLYWFSDLTVSDPYYGLPIITCCTMMATIKVGADAQPVSGATASKMVKYVLPLLPIVIFPFTCHFPAAILWYWVCTNLFSLLQVGFLRIPKIRTYFKIDKRIKHKPEPKTKKGMIKDMKESFSNMKAVSKITERQKFDARLFEQAGRAPLVKTFKHNPLTDIKAKPRDT